MVIHDEGDKMAEPERNWVGEIALKYFSDENPRVRLEIDEMGSTLLTMDQVESLASILRGWVEKYHAAERAEDTARRRTQGAKDGWEIRRAKGVSDE